LDGCRGRGAEPGTVHLCRGRRHTRRYRDRNREPQGAAFRRVSDGQRSHEHAEMRTLSSLCAQLPTRPGLPVGDCNAGPTALTPSLCVRDLSGLALPADRRSAEFTANEHVWRC